MIIQDIKSNHHLWSYVLLIIFRYGSFIRQHQFFCPINFLLMIPYHIANQLLIEGLLHCHFPITAVIGSGLSLFHPYEIMLNKHVKIGQNVTIRNGVTIGVKFQGGYGGAVIGDNVDIGTGAKIIGQISIGNNSIIGANAVVTKSFPSNSVIAGVPAKLLRTINELER